MHPFLFKRKSDGVGKKGGTLKGINDSSSNSSSPSKDATKDFFHPSQMPPAGDVLKERTFFVSPFAKLMAADKKTTFILRRSVSSSIYLLFFDLNFKALFSLSYFSSSRNDVMP